MKSISFPRKIPLALQNSASVLLLLFAKAIITSLDSKSTAFHAYLKQLFWKLRQKKTFCWSIFTNHTKAFSEVILRVGQIRVEHNNMYFCILFLYFCGRKLLMTLLKMTKGQWRMEVNNSKTARPSIFSPNRNFDHQRHKTFS